MNPTTGALSITSKCPGTTLTWNIQGPPGPAGHLSPSAATAIEGDLALIHGRLERLDAAVADMTGQQARQRNAFLRLRRRFQSTTALPAQMTDLSEMSDQTSLALQKATDRQSKLLTMLSNIAKEFADTNSTLEANLK